MRNGASVIGDQLDALAAQTTSCEWELIVADNGSTDDTVGIVMRHPITGLVATRVVDVPAPVGVNAARNAGTAAARASLILGCDCDDVAGPGWIDSYWKRLRDLPPHVAAGPLDISRLNSPATQAWGHALHASDVMDGGAPAGWGSNMAFHRGIWTLLGGFDESFTNGGDDLDFFVRAWQSNVPYVWVDSANMSYRLSPKPVALLRKVYSHGRAQVRLAEVHATGGPAKQRFAAAALTMLKMCIRAVQSLFTRRHDTKQLVRFVVFQAGMMRGMLSRRARAEPSR